MRRSDRPDEMPTFHDDGPHRGTTPSPENVRLTTRLRTHRGFQVLFVLLLAVVPLLIVARLHDAPPPIRIVLNDRPVLVSIHTTFGGFVHEKGLKAHDGRLLDVEGKVL